MKYKLYHGNSPYLSLEDVHDAIKTNKTEIPNAEVTIVQADVEEPLSIIDTLSAQSLFCGSRIIFIKRIYRNKKKDSFLDKLLQVIKDSQSIDTVLFWEDQKIKSNTKYYKFFKDGNFVIEENELNKRTFYTWLKKELEKFNLKIETDATKVLAERTNYDPERCHNELQKIKLLGDSIITKDVVDEVTSDTLENNIWQLIDSINDGDTVTSVFIIEKMRLQGIDENYVLSMLGRNLRLITLAKELSEKGFDYRAIASSLKVAPFTVPSLVHASKRYSYDKIKMLYTKLSNLDLQIKTGMIDGYLGLTLICPYL